MNEGKGAKEPLSCPVEGRAPDAFRAPKIPGPGLPVAQLRTTRTQVARPRADNNASLAKEPLASSGTQPTGPVVHDPEDIPILQLKKPRAACNPPQKDEPLTFSLTPRRNDVTAAESAKMAAIASQQGGHSRFDYVHPKAKTVYRCPVFRNGTTGPRCNELVNSNGLARKLQSHIDQVHSLIGRDLKDQVIRGPKRSLDLFVPKPAKRPQRERGRVGAGARDALGQSDDACCPADGLGYSELTPGQPQSQETAEESAYGALATSMMTVSGNQTPMSAAAGTAVPNEPAAALVGSSPKLGSPPLEPPTPNAERKKKSDAQQIQLQQSLSECPAA